MTCRSCGGAIAEGSRFCVHCGSEQSATAATSPVDARLGLTLDSKYRIDARIGAGGMATVYRATRLLIGDAVAVKILHPDQVRDPQATERFRREAQAAARLKHPNAVAIYDFGVSETGLVYLVMELQTELAFRGPHYFSVRPSKISSIEMIGTFQLKTDVQVSDGKLERREGLRLQPAWLPVQHRPYWCR